jgi:hypothetical protein
LFYRGRMQLAPYDLGLAVMSAPDDIVVVLRHDLIVSGIRPSDE